MADPSLKEQFAVALARWGCELGGDDYDQIADTEEGVAMRRRNSTLADRLVHIVMVRLQGALVDSATGTANTIDAELERFASVVDLSLSHSDREQIARTIVDAFLVGFGVVTKEMGGPLTRIEPIYVQLLDRRV